MRYTNVTPQTDKKLSENLINDGWKRIKEPNNFLSAVFLSFPFVLLNGVIVLSLFYLIDPSMKSFLSNINSFEIEVNISILTIFYILSIFAFMIVHEFLHAVFINGFLKSKKVFWGFKGSFAFVYTTEKFSKRRYLVITIAPFILLSILLPLVLSAFGIHSNFIIALCLLNAIGSCVDSLMFFLIVFQVPKNAQIVSNGFETLCK